MSDLSDFIVDDNKMSNKTQKILSLLFLLIACAMALFEYTEINDYWFDSELEIKPGIISTFIAIFLIAPLYMRNILKWNKSIYTLLSLILFLFLFSSLIELATGGGGLKGGVIQFLIIGAVALSWLGMRAIAGISWILLLIAVAYAQIQNNIAMGLYGFVYITSGFIGLVFHSELSPGSLIQGLKKEFSSSMSMVDQVKDDISHTTDVAKNTFKSSV